MAKDIFHEQVKEALIKDGWIITHDPYPLKHLRKDLEVDLGAEMIIAAEKHAIEIAVEIKSFIGHSEVHDFYKALGQFKTYLRIMRKLDPRRILFLLFHLMLTDPFLVVILVERQWKRKIYECWYSIH